MWSSALVINILGVIDVPLLSNKWGIYRQMEPVSSNQEGTRVQIPYLSYLTEWGLTKHIVKPFYLGLLPDCSMIGPWAFHASHDWSMPGHGVGKSPHQDI